MIWIILAFGAHFISCWIRIRIQEANLMRIHADPDPDPKHWFIGQHTIVNSARPITTTNIQTVQVLPSRKEKHKLKKKMIKNKVFAKI